MRAAVYSGTRNVYEQMLIAAKSLLMHSNVEKIYFLIEDDQFPQDLPEEIECINISDQTYFNPDGPNFKNVCTYMVLIRAAYSKIFPQLDKILSLDMDTIVNENISDLWELDLTNYYMAAVEETELTQQEGSYINMGVAMLNLKKIREEKKDDEMIEALNTYLYRYKEQDCFNEFFRGKILILPSDYNCCIQSAIPAREKITHFAGIYKFDSFPHFNYYKELPLSQLERNIKDNITLDIIIPTYKNKKGLRRTLNSITNYPNINIIVVDDNSNLEYTDIIEEYPYINIFYLYDNVGPGMARQYGIEHSVGTFITFLDTGDYFYDGGLELILKNIQENTYIKMHTYSYVFSHNNVLADKPDNKTIGKVYKRSFIEMYNIHFSKEGSYADEDYGFNQACRLILRNLAKYGFLSTIEHTKIPIYYEHIDPNSLTKNNNSEFFYTKLVKGIIINGLHAINIAKNWHVADSIIIDEYNHIMAQEYHFILSIAQERPEYLDDNWIIVRDFYLNHYRTYEKLALPQLPLSFSQVTMQLNKTRTKLWTKNIPINITRFIQELRTEEFTPIRYLT